MTAKKEPLTPFLTVDIIIHLNPKTIILVKRKNPPLGLALPGGFVDRGEDPRDAAIREAAEETQSHIQVVQQFRAYGDPQRDPRFHTVSLVYVAKTHSKPKAGDDAREVKLFDLTTPIPVLQFDHGIILNDYLRDLYPQLKPKLGP
jgi:ADP-ribose pyrophosphatase YjhB (NUDIX family)